MKGRRVEINDSDGSDKEEEQPPSRSTYQNHRIQPKTKNGRQCVALIPIEMSPLGKVEIQSDISSYPSPMMKSYSSKSSKHDGSEDSALLSERLLRFHKNNCLKLQYKNVLSCIVF